MFITGISPLSLSSLANGFNVMRNVSFDESLAGLCGLTRSDLEGALNKVCKNCENGKYLFEMTRLYNGYHLCMDQTVQTVYNTETCLSYLQCRLEGEQPQLLDPENSEISKGSLAMFSSSAFATSDLKNALRPGKDSPYTPLTYSCFNLSFTLQDLVCEYLRSSSHLC
jgi:hypothetical protein